jgi:hypothetical protein
MNRTAKLSCYEKSERGLAFPHRAQTTYGKQAINEFQGGGIAQCKPACACGGGCPRCQAAASNLKIGEPDDAYEREADAVADRVMRMADSEAPVSPAASGLQRKCSSCEKQEREGANPQTAQAWWTVRDSREAEFAAHQAELLPPSSDERRSMPGAGVPPDAAPVHTGGFGLPGPTRELAEAALGFDLEGIRIHHDEHAARLSGLLGASAVTIGHHIYFGRGRYAPGTENGDRLAIHEAAHAVQSSHASRPLGPLARDRSADIDTNLEFWDSTADAQAALALLLSMNDSDFNDTLAAMIASGSVVRLTSRLSFPENQQLLTSLGRRGTPANRDGLLRVQPLFDLTGVGSLLVYGQSHMANFGPATAPVDPAWRHVVSSNPADPFTGSGATGMNPQNAPISLSDMETMRCQAWASTRTSIGLTERISSGCLSQPASPTGSGVQWHQYNLTPGFEMLYNWSNPIKGSLAVYTAGLSAGDRLDQARLLLAQPISTHFATAYQTGLPSRAQVIRAAAQAHRLTPQVVAAIVLAEQRDQSRQEDAADYAAGTVAHRASTSIGLGQVTGTAVRQHDLFADLASPTLRAALNRPIDVSTSRIATLLASDEFNLFATARYIRIVANIGAGKSPASLPNTMARFPGLDLSRYALDASAWSEDHVALLGSEYTSAPFDDNLVVGWGEHVREAFRDVNAAGIF